MRIAVNTRFLGLPEAEGYAHFTKGLILSMHQHFPEDVYHLMYDRQPFSAIQGRNIFHHIAGPPARHPLLWKWWYDISMTRMAGKQKADVLFSPDGFCSLTSSIPQVLAIHDLAFLHYPHGIKSAHRKFYTHYTPAFIRKAKHIITVSEFSREDIIRHYPFAEKKITVVYNDADPDFKPLDFDSRERHKEACTQGCEYFLFVGAIHPRKNLVSLLKGFSWFKERQRSRMKLVLAGRMAWSNDAFLQLLASYKYRDDVILTGYLPQDKLFTWMGAAYALVYPSAWEGFGLPVLEAMRAGVPVITSGNSAMPEVAGDAAIYVDPDDTEGWGKAMGVLFKDEDFRAQCITRGHHQSGKFSWKNSGEQLHEIFQQVLC